MEIPATNEHLDRLEIALDDLPEQVQFQIDPSETYTTRLKREHQLGCVMFWVAYMIWSGIMVFGGSAPPSLSDTAGFVFAGLFTLPFLLGIAKFYRFLHPLKFVFGNTYAEFTTEYSRKIKIEPGAKLVICGYKNNWWKVYSSHKPSRYTRIKKKWFPDFPNTVKVVVDGIHQGLHKNPNLFG